MIWILVAHRADARLFKSSGRNRDTQLLREFDFPDGRRQNREIDTDAKGSRYSTSAGRGNGRAGFAPSAQMKHGLDPQLEASEHLADIFAKQLAEVLNHGRKVNEYDELIIAAEPGFLGKVRRFLDGPTTDRITRTLNRNLSGLSLAELVAQLETVVRTRKTA